MAGQAEDVGGDAAHDYDVVVVGAGPAGSTAAGYLAKHGHSVLLLEGERFPRFHLAGPELSRGLFAAVSGDAEQLLKDFEVVGVTSKARSDGGGNGGGNPARSEG
jgi:flavin-dependent dehydrogenase